MTDYTEAPLPPRRAIRFDPTRGREHVYDDARRHSRTVRWLKLALPALAVAGVIGFFAATQFTTLGPGIEAVVSMSGINVEEKSLIMKTPHISGFEATHKAYDVTAERAIQELANPKVVKLETIVANLGMGGDGTATVNAKTGIFDSTSRMLRLFDGIVLKTTNGYHATLIDALINVDKGHLVSKKPVQIKAAKGTLKASAIEIQDRGKRVIFTGGVSVTYFPPQGEKSPPAAKPKAPAKPGEAVDKAKPKTKQALADAPSVQ